MASPTKRHKHKRLSLSNVFEGLEITPTTTPRPSPSVNLAQSIRHFMQSTFRHGNGSVTARSWHGVETQFTIAMDDAYEYKIGFNDFDPDEVYPEIVSLGNELSTMFPLTPAQESAFDEYILERLARMVYGSNMIEQVGADLSITIRLCMAIFRGEDVPDDIDVGERDADYVALKQSLIRQNLPTNASAILRSRREIVQHAKAAKYMINELCVRGEDLSEAIILKAHSILTYQIDASNTPWTEYSGVYRSDEVSAGLHAFPHHSLVPHKMKSMIRELESDLKEAAKTGDIDPIALASKYTHIFVNIHPFIDGNGRTCRLILNSMLLKYGSFLVSLGGQGDDDRLTYLNIAANGGALEDMYEDAEAEERPKLHKELASFVLNHVKSGMADLIKVLKKQ